MEYIFRAAATCADDGSVRGSPSLLQSRENVAQYVSNTRTHGLNAEIHLGSMLKGRQQQR